MGYDPATDIVPVMSSHFNIYKMKKHQRKIIQSPGIDFFIIIRIIPEL